MNAFFGGGDLIHDKKSVLYFIKRRVVALDNFFDNSDGFFFIFAVKRFFDTHSFAYRCNGIDFYCQRSCFRYYGETITYLGMSAPISILSTISWLLHPYEKTDEVEVSRVTKKQVFVICGLALLVTGFFYFILKALGNANLIVSVISVTTSFIASYLAFLRSPWYAVAYSVNDIILIILWILASMEKTDYVPMIMCFVMFLINDLYGFYSWRKMLKRQRSNAGL